MDVIYPVRPGDKNDELRYSLRSLAENFPHDRVVIVGYMPPWVRNVEYIEGNKGPSTHANVYNNIRLAVERDDLSDRVVIFNDDFFVTEPVDAAPAAFRCSLDDHIRLPRVQRNGGWWLESLTLTRTCLQAHGIEKPTSYELHMPIEVDRRRMAEVLDLFRYVQPVNPPQWRSLYGNLADHGGEKLKDVKCFDASALRRPFHSTEDRSFPRFHRELHKLFPEPSPYEAA
ncbi:hypothetical protein SEA_SAMSCHEPPERS_4 [Mycobacterium phage SamScheppers]|nr:hypothetical protein SEA_SAMSCHEPPERS_4 [Mycobacterium phage SamScheppers]